jgi:MoxR-like ATPase
MAQIAAPVAVLDMLVQLGRSRPLDDAGNLFGDLFAQGGRWLVHGELPEGDFLVDQVDQGGRSVTGHFDFVTVERHWMGQHRPEMTPGELYSYLNRLIEKRLMLSLMIWGPPGVGKSSVVAQVAREHELELIDVRLSQLAPTDLRGLPVPEQGVARWYPPEFLPRGGRGILFLDELNMAPPAVQGIAQQLILDRKVGSYTVPEGWYLWAAGNRKEDRASVFDMPAPLGNRFLHLEVQPDFDSFKLFAIEQGLHEQVVAFLSYRPGLLHKMDAHRPAWPSPRSWAMASQLHESELPIDPAVGGPTAEEFRAFLAIYSRLQGLDEILQGRGAKHPFPEEPSLRYALTVGLSLRSSSVEQGLAAFRWITEKAGAEWMQLFTSNLLVNLETRNLKGLFVQAVRQDEKLFGALRETLALAMGARP